MRFIDLDKLKIVKSYSFKTQETEIDLTHAATIFEMKEKVRQSFNYFIEPSAIENHYVVNIKCGNPTDEDADAVFLTIVNVVSAIFFDMMCTTKGRPRERRLDVPENLKVLKTNMSLLKRAVNSQTHVDIFNLTICWALDSGDELIYELVPQDKEDE